MNVRAQLVMVFNLDKCIGCHTCSISCKNIWTDRKGAEYMWWNNVETKPGVGYPKKWENQDLFKGGWLRENGKLKLRALGKGPTLFNMFFQPNMPKLDDYYEPFDFDYSNLYKAPPGSDQPVAEAFSQVSGERMEEITNGPNWDDDLSGSQIYAANDSNLEDRTLVEDYGRMFMQYLPRICNHCLNPACVASCPSRAIYKRGEDGVVLVDQEVCKGWRFCTSACPYKKVYFNWQSGKAEKCIFCFPRTETGQCNACAHSCVGRIRHVGVLLYDADRVEEALLQTDNELVAAHRSVILDPCDPKVKDAARMNGVTEQWLEAAEKSPVYSLIKEFGVALPLHPEFRTMPMAYYIPSLSPVISSGADLHELALHGTIPLLEKLRAPISFLASLLSGGNQEVIAEALQKLIALRVYKRAGNLGQPVPESTLEEAGLDEAGADKLYRLFTIGGYRERNVIPTQQREEQDSYQRKGASGFRHPQENKESEMTIAASYEALARLLDYPENKEQLQADYVVVSTFLHKQRLDSSIASFAEFAAASPLSSLQEEYVASFDFNPATAPYLGHHLFGDNQKKGSYMIMLKQEFERAGYTPTGVELPDHLSVLLGFLAHLARQEESGARQPFITECVLPGVERFHDSFDTRHESHWKVLVGAAKLLCAEDCKEVHSC